MPYVHVLIGFLMALALHLAVTLTMMGLSWSFGGGPVLGLMFWIGIGLFQWVYLVPVALYLRRKGETRRLQGLLLGGGLTLLLNGLCWTLLMSGYWRIGG